MWKYTIIINLLQEWLTYYGILLGWIKVAGESRLHRHRHLYSAIVVDPNSSSIVRDLLNNGMILGIKCMVTYCCNLLNIQYHFRVSATHSMLYCNLLK